MVKVINVNDMKDLTVLGQEEFEKNALEGPTFKRIVRSIEDSAIQGYTGGYETLDSSDDIRELKVIQKALIAAGYKCEITPKQETNIFGMKFTVTKFAVNWE